MRRVNGIDHTEERIPFTCCLDCGSRCELTAVKRGGRLVRFDTPERDDPPTAPRLVPCARGRATRRLLSAPERVLHPLRRVGGRGEGRFERVDWAQALDLVAEKLESTRAEHSAAAILSATGPGASGSLGVSGAAAARRFFSFWGEATHTVGNMSSHCAGLASSWLYGESVEASDRATLLDSRLIVLWSMNPAETRMGPNTEHFIAEARDRGCKVVLVDPRLTDSGVLADQWIPIRPGTDAALAAALAFVLKEEGLVDREFLERCTSGYDAYRDYVTGEADGVPKTPEWASPITGAPADVIRQLARDLGTLKPAAILAGWGMQRALNGEQAPRAVITLSCMIGSVGVPGGDTGAGSIARKGGFPIRGMPSGPGGPGRTVSSASWAESILAGDLDPPLKVAYIVASNLVNRSPDTQANIRALNQLDFVVVHEQFMTPTAQQADLILPISLDSERWELIGSWGHSAHVFLDQPVAAPAGETRTDYWVFSQLAERLGFGERYSEERSEQEWVRMLADRAGLDADALGAEGPARSDDQPRVALAAFRADPAAKALYTRSGLIELKNPEAEAHGLPDIAAYVPLDAGDPEALPLQLLTPHSRLRSNSCLHANPWLQCLEPQALWINTSDAAARGITQGDEIEVASEHGATIVPAKVTERIMPGVVCLYQGGWYEPGDDGVDRGGCANVLTGHHVSRSGGMATHSTWVEVRRAES